MLQDLTTTKMRSIIKYKQQMETLQSKINDFVKKEKKNLALLKIKNIEQEKIFQDLKKTIQEVSAFCKEWSELSFYKDSSFVRSRLEDRYTLRLSESDFKKYQSNCSYMLKDQDINDLLG